MRPACSSCHQNDTSYAERASHWVDPGGKAARDLQNLETVASSVTARGWLLALLVLLPGLSVAQGLGDAAQEEAERRTRQGATAGARVYSNADLSEAEEAWPAGDGDGGATEAAPEDPDGDGDGESPEVDEVRERLDRAAARREEQEREWRARAAAARARVEMARSQHDAVCKTGGFFVGGG